MRSDDFSVLLSPASYDGFGGMVDLQGWTRAAAFDELARRAADPAFQALIQQYHTTPQGRTLLALVRRAWDAEGLPCPWDNLLDLTPV